MGRHAGTPKTGGRQVGTKNKIQSNVKCWIRSLIDDNRDKLERDFQALTPKERWSLTEKLLNYVTPKEQKSEINLTNLNDADIDNLIDKL